MNSSTSGFTSRKETTAEADDTNSGNAKAIALMSDQTGGELPSVSMNFLEAEKETERFREFLQCLSENGDDHVETDIFGGPFLGAQHHELFSSQAAGGQHNELGASFQLFPESLQRDKAYKDSKKSLGSLSKGSVKETGQRHRSIRRHLHFEAAIACKNTGNGTHETANLCLPVRHAVFESLVPPHVEPRGISGSWQARSCAQTATFCLSEFESIRSAQNCGNRAVSARIPSGGGFHLNSIVRPDSIGPDSSISKKLGSNLHQQEEKLIPVRDHYLGKEMDGIPVLSFSREIYTHLRDEQQESKAAVGAGSSSYESISIMQPPCDSLHLITFEQQATLCEGAMPSSEKADIVELNQMSPERNRKKAKYTVKSEGCRRCNCKRSRCLKLYCECFAAGVYCLDTCTCENCFNKPEYEDTVLDKRQQIEARNPLAFAPKVVKHATDSPAYMMEEGNWRTPSSSRHKTGCNCKKSKCSKKYCECFQAGVGCCDGCRCEGCYNPYGNKRETIYRRAERWSNPSQEQRDSLESHSDWIKAERPNQFSSTWEELADVGHLTPPSHCLVGAVASSASLNIKDCSKILLGQSQQESSLLSPSGYLNWRHSPRSLTPKSYGSEALPELSSDSFVCNILEDDTPDTLKNTCTPITKGVKSCSPNQTRLSPSQIRSNELRSSSSWRLGSGRKSILEDWPSFPSLTPYSKSQAGIHQNDGDHKGSTGY